jgi:hypothetical protein
VVLPAPVWPTIAIGVPDVAEFDVATRFDQPARAGLQHAGRGFIEKFEYAFGSGHGGLQDVEFFAEILNRQKETLRVLHEGDEHADFDEAGERAQSAVPEGDGDGGDAEKLHGGIEQREGQNGVLIGVHVGAVVALEFGF